MLGRCLVFLDFIGDHELVGHDHDNENNEKSKIFTLDSKLRLGRFFEKVEIGRSAMFSVCECVETS